MNTTPSSKAPSVRGVARISLDVSHELRRELRVEAAVRDTTLRRLIEEYVRRGLSEDRSRRHAS